MATKLFLRSTQTNGIGATYFDMVTTAGAGSTTAVVTTTAAGTEIQWTQSAGGAELLFVSGRTPSGGFTLTTTDISAWFHESGTGVNAGGAFRIFKRTDAGVETELAGGLYSDGVEFTKTTPTEMLWTGNPTDTAFAENDRILLKIKAANVGVMGAGTATLTYNAADAATGDSFFNIAETVAFKAENVINSGAVSAIGASTAAGRGAATIAATAFAAGTSSVTASGASIVPAAITAAGTSSAVVEGTFIIVAAGDIAAAGSSAVQAEGALIAAGPITSTGTSTAQTTGALIVAAEISADGTSTLAAEGSTAAGGTVEAGAMSAAGLSNLAAEGAAIVAAEISAAGSSTTDVEGAAIVPGTIEAGAFSVAGTSDCQVVGSTAPATTRTIYGGRKPRRHQNDDAEVEQIIREIAPRVFEHFRKAA